MQKKNEILSAIQRLSELLIICAMLFLFAFFAAHQWLNTGFFTQDFGRLEMLALYAPIIIALVAPAIRAFTGRRNPARLFEVATNLALATGSLWLLIVFPLDYTHLADVLPEGLRFLLSWVTDDMGKFVLLLQVIIGPIASIPIIWKYWISAREEPSLERVSDIA